MSLVWLGYRIDQLGTLRSNSVGVERYPDAEPNATKPSAPQYPGLLPRQQGMLDRYAGDASSFMAELARVLGPQGQAVLVVGDSTLSGTFVHNSKIIQRAAEFRGFVLTDKQTRPLPTSSRYLPPPASTDGALSKRMRHEVVMRFQRETAKV